MKQHGSKLSAKQVSDLRLDRVRGWTYEQLAYKYRISISTVFKIINGFLWKNQAPAKCPHCKETL
jgi:Mor family transcriptional regulator